MGFTERDDDGQALRYTKARLLAHSVLGAFVSDISLE